MAVPTIHGFESLIGSTSTADPKAISLTSQTYTAGDYCLFIAAAKAAITSVTGATDDTYAQLAQQTNVEATLALYEGTINGSLDASATVDQSVAERAFAGLITIAGAADNASQPHVLGADTSGTSNDPSAAGLTTTIPDCLVLAIIAANGGHNLTTLNAALPAGWTLLGSSWRTIVSDAPSNNAHTTVAVATKAMAAPGATGAATWTDSIGASQEWVGRQIAIAPAVVATVGMVFPPPMRRFQHMLVR